MTDKEILELKEIANQNLNSSSNREKFGEVKTALKALRIIDDLQMKLKVAEQSAERRLKMFRDVEEKLILINSHLSGDDSQEESNRIFNRVQRVLAILNPYFALREPDQSKNSA